FTYGPNHERRTQTQGTSAITYYGGAQEVLTDVSHNVTEIKTYWPMGLGVEIDRPGQAASELDWTHTDHLGSVIAMTDIDGNLKEALGYDAWGNRRNAVGAPVSIATTKAAQINETTDNKGYTGQEQITSLELVHLNGRVYDPLVGKFLSGDPMVADPKNGQNYNRYSYVLNNPMNGTDPTGFRAVSTGLGDEDRSYSGFRSNPAPIPVTRNVNNSSGTGLVSSAPRQALEAVSGADSASSAPSFNDLLHGGNSVWQLAGSFGFQFIVGNKGVSANITVGTTINGMDSAPFLQFQYNVGKPETTRGAFAGWGAAFGPAYGEKPETGFAESPVVEADGGAGLAVSVVANTNANGQVTAVAAQAPVLIGEGLGLSILHGTQYTATWTVSIGQVLDNLTNQTDNFLNGAVNFMNLDNNVNLNMNFMSSY
ncbi:RHS repeat-associated protein, partial [Oxalobacteraceae bacterium GrIS 2.11]